MDGSGWEVADELRERIRALECQVAYWKGRAEGATERADLSRAVVMRCVAAAAEFLRTLDVELDLDDPTSPLKAAADMLEEALLLARQSLQ